MQWTLDTKLHDKSYLTLRSCLLDGGATDTIEYQAFLWTGLHFFKASFFLVKSLLDSFAVSPRDNSGASAMAGHPIKQLAFPDWPVLPQSQFSNWCLSLSSSYFPRMLKIIYTCYQTHPFPDCQEIKRMRVLISYDFESHSTSFPNLLVGPSATQGFCFFLRLYTFFDLKVEWRQQTV